jgi:thiamine-phosphate pyrophosphorylase
VTHAATECRIYAVVQAGEAARERLQAALAAAKIASVLIVPPGGAMLDASTAGPLVEAAQRKGAAALVADDARLARALRADGVHLSAARNPRERYAEARSVLGGRGIVGVDVGVSRHDAMTVAEAGADYIAFGAPAQLKDRDKARVRRDELVAWWAEIFEAPCVAFDVETPDEAELLARSGADFVALALPAGATPAAVGSLVAGIAAGVRIPATAG